MSPKEPISLPFRWEFSPAKSPKNGTILWKWHAYSHVGELAMESRFAFDTLTDCKVDATKSGYKEPSGDN